MRARFSRWLGPAVLGWAGLSFGAACRPPLAAQAVVQRTPNLEDGWTVRPGVVQFNFLHRFTVSDPPARKVTSFPTFMVATGLPAQFAAGWRYATNSRVFAGVPNEHEIWVRRAVLREASGPIGVALTAAYNSAAQSVDGELSLSRNLGRLRLLGAARAMSSGFDTDDFLWGAGGGSVVHLTRWLSLAGDVFTIFNEDQRELDPAWGFGAQLAIPFTPLTLSIQVSNTNSASIQGSSVRALDDIAVGFEFTIPITLARYFGGRAAGPEGVNRRRSRTEVGRGRRRRTRSWWCTSGISPSRLPSCTSRPAPACAGSTATRSSTRSPRTRERSSRG